MKKTFLLSRNSSRCLLMASVAMSVLALASPAGAVDALDIPVGERVVDGSASFDRSEPGRLDIHQGTNTVVIDWDSFNIGVDATTEFYQPSSSALAVNRVVGGSDPTQILGNLRANGRVMVLDRNGVIFGKAARVDVGGIVASTGDVDTAAVMSGAGRINLDHMTGGSVENYGTITAAEGGLVALVAPSVRNSGVINARLGRVALAAGDRATVDLYGDNLIELALDQKTTKAVVENAGTVLAESGTIQLTAMAARDAVDSVVNMSGVVSASSVTQEGGKIVLGAGRVNMSGKASASGTKGGTVIVKGTDDLDLTGTILAQGARAGFVETSAPTLRFGEGAAVAADKWLIDPTSLSILDAGCGVNCILTGTIEAALALGDVEIATPDAGPSAGNISLEGSVDWASAFGLTLTAHHDIHIREGGSLNATGGGDIILNAGDDIRIQGTTPAVALYTSGGDMTLNSADMISIRPARYVDAAGGNILFNNAGGLLAAVDTIRTTGTGTITINMNKANEFDPSPLMPNTVQGAIDAILNTGSGDNVIHVGAGLWDENVVASSLEINNLFLYGAKAGVDARDLLLRGDSTQESILGSVAFYSMSKAGIDGFWFDGGEGSASTPISFFYNYMAAAHNNVIQNFDDYGIYGSENFYFPITQNRINYIDGDGIRSDYFYYTGVFDNDIAHVSDDGIHVSNGYFAEIIGNNISDVGSGGGMESAMMIILPDNDNGADDWYGSDGIFVYQVGDTDIGRDDRVALMEYEEEEDDYALRILNNTVFDAEDDGIEVLTSAGSMLIDGNNISLVGGDGITVERLFGECWYCEEYDAYDPMMMSAYYGPYDYWYGGYLSAVITNNIVSNAGYRGIAVNGLDETEIGDNVVSNAGQIGVHVTGYNYGYHFIYGNVVNNTPIGMKFQSGLIDMTGSSNTMNGGLIGYQFDPLMDDYWYPTVASRAMMMVDDSYDYYSYIGLDLYNDTIGTSVFNGQSEFYVELLGNALFWPGAPTLEDGVNATYDGVSPASTGGLVTPDQLAHLESMFWHYNDDSNVGLFFFGTRVDQPEPDQGFGIEDVYNGDQPKDDDGKNGARFVVTGLPSLPGGAGGNGGGGTAADLNAITPAAGGEDNATPEQIAALEPAAGGEDSACWAEVVDKAGQGQVASYGFTGDPAAALTDAIKCGQQNQ